MDILGIPIPVFVVLAVGAYIVFKFNLLSLLNSGGENRHRAELESSWMPTASEEGAVVISSNISRGNAIVLEDIGKRPALDTDADVGTVVGPFRLRRVIMNFFGTTVVVATEQFSAANEAAARKMYAEWCAEYMRLLPPISISNNSELDEDCGIKCSPLSRLIDGNRCFDDRFNPEKVHYISDNN